MVRQAASRPDRYRAGVGAYLLWVPALGGQAPLLRDYRDDLEVLVLSAVGDRPASAQSRRPAQAAEGSDPGVHRQAGALLRRLHDAQPPVGSPDFAREKMAEFDTVAPDAALLPDEDLLGFARTTVGSWTGCLRRPGCRATWTTASARGSPRRGAVRHRLRMGPARSLGRRPHPAALRPVSQPPHLQEAFLDGYGRTLTAH